MPAAAGSAEEMVMVAGATEKGETVMARGVAALAAGEAVVAM